MADVIGLFRHGSQIWPQLSAASPGPTKRPQPKVMIAIVVMIKLKLWPATGCEAKVGAELSSCPSTVLFMQWNVVDAASDVTN